MGGNVQTLGMALYTDYLFPFEVVSMLLLVAMIGAIYLAKKRV
jgi:NADH-quinone oxidoreductase subunit J